MSLAWALVTAAGSAIGWMVWTTFTLLWAKRKLLPLYHKHVEQQAALLVAEREAASSPRRPASDPMTKVWRG